MKSKIKKKKVVHFSSAEQKFIKEQEYAEQGFHLDDPSRDLPDYVDENGIDQGGEDDTAGKKLTKRNNH